MADWFASLGSMHQVVPKVAGTDAVCKYFSSVVVDMLMNGWMDIFKTSMRPVTSSLRTACKIHLT